MSDIPETQIMLNAGRAAAAPITLENPLQAVVLPPQHTVHALEQYLEKYLPEPRRTKAVVNLHTLDSFLAYVTEFKTLDTHIFALVPVGNGAPCFTAIIDYHQKAVAKWCEHRALYAPKFTEEWTRWMAQNKATMNQTQLATFLEENQLLIQSPPGAELLELVGTLEGHNNANISQMVRLSNGKVKCHYEEDVELKGTVNTVTGAVDFPTTLVVVISPFDGGPAYKIVCRLRYRIENRRLSFWFECVDVHLVIKDAVNDMVKSITEKLEIVPLMGTP